jgi:hypothetical protein
LIEYNLSSDKSSKSLEKRGKERNIFFFFKFLFRLEFHLSIPFSCGQGKKNLHRLKILINTTIIDIGGRAVLRPSGAVGRTKIWGPSKKIESDQLCSNCILLYWKLDGSFVFNINNINFSFWVEE